MERSPGAVTGNEKSGILDREQKPRMTTGVRGLQGGGRTGGSELDRNWTRSTVTVGTLTGVEQSGLGCVSMKDPVEVLSGVPRSRGEPDREHQTVLGEKEWRERWRGGREMTSSSSPPLWCIRCGSVFLWEVPGWGDPQRRVGVGWREKRKGSTLRTE